MKITIEIPSEYYGEFEKDKFEETFQRMKADAHCLAGNYEKETISMLIEAFKNAKEKQNGNCRLQKNVHI